MPTQNWLERAQCELVKRRVPPAYARRLLMEWSDHLEDLKEEAKMSQSVMREDALGNPVELVRAVAASRPWHSNRTTIGRRVLLFVLSPAPALLAAYAAVFTIVGLIEDQLGLLASLKASLGADSQALPWVVKGAVWTMLFAPLLALVACYCRMGTKWRVSQGWVWCSCGMFAFFAAALVVSSAFSRVASGSNVSIGLSWGASLLGWQPLVQGMAPLIFAAILLRWRNREAAAPPLT